VELAEFLRNRRAAVQPQEVGLPGGPRRRTPGLRREEVALVAGVGTTWYTWLEQGRDVRASTEVLNAIADALRLNDVERQHLLRLGRGVAVPSASAPASASTVPATLRRVVEGLDPVPAIVVNGRWDYLYWNRAATVALGDPLKHPPGRRNAVWMAFMDPARRRLCADYEDCARSVVARLRADLGANLGDSSFEALVGELRDVSPQFAALWSQHEIHLGGDGPTVFNHPSGRRLVFEHSILDHASGSQHRLGLFMPDGPTRAWLQAQLDAVAT
jgi:transcriptional regulator with XRE-family HTH domain